MKSGIRLPALGVALAVNAFALGAVHRAMVEGTERAHLAAQETARVVVSAEHQTPEIAKANCPAPKAL
jgi:hypothetical protein